MYFLLDQPVYQICKLVFATHTHTHTHTHTQTLTFCIKKCKSKVAFKGYDILFDYFVVEAKSKNTQKTIYSY